MSRKGNSKKSQASKSPSSADPAESSDEPDDVLDEVDSGADLDTKKQQSGPSANVKIRTRPVSKIDGASAKSVKSSSKTGSKVKSGIKSKNRSLKSSKSRSLKSSKSRSSGGGSRAKTGPSSFSEIIRANIQLNKPSTSSKGRVRVNPLKKTSKPNQNVPMEASASNIDEQVTMIGGAFVLDPVNVFNDQVRREFHTSNVSQMTGSIFDPEPFLLPVETDAPVSNNFLDRKLDPLKLIDFMVRHMTAYYDLTTDRDAFSLSRQAMDDQLWDTLAYLIPLLCNQLIELIQDEPLIVSTEPNSVVFGDVHGNLNDLWHIYRHYIDHKHYANHRMIFLGDYVDRGPKPIEIVCLLFALKLAYPKRFVILRGNHEVMKVNRKYGLQALCEHIFQDTYLAHPVMAKLVYQSFNRAFTYLPLAAVIKGSGTDRSIFCCHGGIPSQYLKPNREQKTGWTVAQLNELDASIKPVALAPSKHAPPPQLALNELLWNDPIPIKFREKRRFKRKNFYRNKKRGGHCSYFTEKGLQAFLEENHLQMVIRGHQYRNCKQRGYNYDFNRRLLTVFSSSNYCGTEENNTGCVLITGERCQVEARLLRDRDEAGKFADFNHLKIIVDDRTKQIAEIYF